MLDARGTAGMERVKGLFAGVYVVLDTPMKRRALAVAMALVFFDSIRVVFCVVDPEARSECGGWLMIMVKASGPTFSRKCSGDCRRSRSGGRYSFSPPAWPWLNAALMRGIRDGKRGDAATSVLERSEMVAGRLFMRIWSLDLVVGDAESGFITVRGASAFIMITGKR